MGLKKSEILADPLVKSTLDSFKEAIREKYKNREYGPDLDAMDSSFDDIPPLKVLLNTDSLDSVTAAVIMAENISGWVDFDDVEPKLDKDVAKVMRLMHDSEMSEMGPYSLLGTDNPTALKLIVSTVAAIASGDEFEEIKAEAHPVELQMMMGEMGTMFAEMTESMTESGNWKALPPPLLDLYIQSYENIAGLATSKVQKRMMTEIVQNLKTEIAKANAEEIAAAMPPPQIDPESKFEQLKEQAKKLRPM